MEGFAVSAPQSSSSHQLNFSASRKVSLSRDSIVIEKTLALSVETSPHSLGIDFSQPYKSQSISADEIIAKLNARLKSELPEGIQSLKPEDVTPEATAERIVKGVTAFFDVYAKQNPQLDPEELLNNFMKEIRSGVSQGYEDAFNILEGLGAFNFEGVQAGIEKTKSLIEEKLKNYEAQKRKELGLDNESASTSIASLVQPQLEAQSGYNLSLVA